MENSAIIVNSDDPLASAWLRKVEKANKYYSDWSTKFKCDELEEYYYGFQWKDGSPTVRYSRYVINFVFANIEIKKPTLLFQNVAFRVKPKPARAEFNFEEATARARNREDALNTVVSDEENEFAEEFESFVVDAFFRFGVMEIGYSANWIENPNAGKPILKSDNDPYYDPDTEDGKDNIIREPKELPENEKVYFKRIPPWRFRVGGTDGKTFKKCSWVGYYDYFRAEDLRANKGLKNLDKLEYAGARSDDFHDDGLDPHTPETEDLAKSGDLVKCWIIYDIRARKKYIFAASQAVTLLEKKYDEFPLISLKFVNKLRGWYPVPLVFNWKSPQDEINHAREQMRLHRQRSARRYLYREGTFADDNEMDKLENGPDMTFAKVQTDPTTAVAPLQIAPLDPAVQQSMLISPNDFNTIAGSSNPERGQADRTTATQSQLIDMRAQMRDTAARMLVANVLKKIGRLVLATIQKRFTLDFWVKIRTDRDNEDFMAEFTEARDEWKSFTAGDLGEDLDFEVDISLDSISPIENASSKQNFVDFLTLLTQFPQIAFDPVLVRETAYRCNYRNEKVIARMAQMAQIAAIGQIEQAKNNLGMQQMQGDQLVKARMAQMQPPNPAQMQNQLQAQVGVPTS